MMQVCTYKITENQSMSYFLSSQHCKGWEQIQYNYRFSVKLAISAGNLSFSLLGDMESLESAYYFVFGSPILDLKSAEALSSAGDIIITKTAWQHVSPNEYLSEELRDGKHTKIYGVGPNWRNIQRSAQYGKDEKLSIVQASSQDERFSEMSLEEEMEDTSHVSSQEMVRSSLDTTAAGEDTNNDRYALRPSVNLCLRQRMLNDLKKFIITPVERGVMADEPIEYLTEIRQVTVLFINCKINISAEITSAQVIDTSNEAFIKVSKIVKENYGCLNKLNMFDKDLLMLIIFGLRGLKHEMESQTALKCATECFESLTGIKNIDGVGAAVTTGKTYCGAFGHALRREYTVISLIVNKAARLMVAYPNRVTCDRETFLHSKLEARNFILQEYKPLKGIVNPGPIYQFKEVEIKEEALTLSSRPLLGREQEMDLYGHLYKVASECRHNGLRGDDDEFFGMLIIQGESRQGKTRLLEELIYSTDPETPLCRFTLAKDDAKKSFGTIRLLFNPLLDLNENSSMSKREVVILKYLTSRNANADAYCLNHIFDINLKTPPGYDTMDRSTKYRHLKHVFTNLCQAAFSVFWVIAIDNAEFIDDESWVLINILTKLKLLFIVATMNLRSMLTQVALEVLKMPKIKIIQMKCIDKWFHVGLVCQILEVEAIPPELEKVIQSRSNGNPGWIESFLISLEQSGGLFIKTITRKVAYETGLVLPPLYMMER
ncbi:unnamed protein product [Ceutorhynchus assimilis]|uniref:Uncharacterized protein n=1 Tax=Ceutorhynchus assimilis TaxID=467358 RepID=A0A9N9QAU3_9CUCU|nr:unnamed protein product [Ceutorhynchus assimilis]